MLRVAAAATSAGANGGTGVPQCLVSMRYAPSFRQPPAEEVIGKNVRDIPRDCVTAYVTPEVISKEEEQALLRFVDPWFARLPYNDGHMDGLIHHYKEFYRPYTRVVAAVEERKKAVAAAEQRGDGATESSSAPHTATTTTSGSYGVVGSAEEEDATTAVNPACSVEDLNLVEGALARVKGLAAHYLPNIPISDRVHFLRLSGSGFIRAHVDETRNSSGIIGGLCLNAGRVMTLTHPDYPKERVELLLAPRCFYAIIGRARYDWLHGVDWVKDDDEHIQRIRQSLVVEDTPIVFDGKETGLRRHDRTAIIFRGVSPLQLFAMRSNQIQATSL